MSFSEVNAMRKEGRLDEALTMARADIERKRDHWSCSALFWCLNDQYKAVEDLDDRNVIVSEMEALYENMNHDGDYATKALGAARRSLLPHSKEMREASDLAKAGQGLEAWRTVSPWIEAGEFAPAQRTSLGWIAYYALHQNRTMDSNERKKILSGYLRLDPEKPSRLHSLMLGEAIATEKADNQNFRFTTFVEMWGLENLTDEDWQDSTTEGGNRMPSRVENLISPYAAEVRDEREVMPSEAFIAVVDKAIERWPNNDNLLRSKAMCLLKMGRRDEAVDAYHRLVMIAPAKAYLWHELADLVESPEERLSLLCKGLSTNNPEDKKGKLRLALARVLVQMQEWEWAQAELDKFRTVYESNGWHLSRTYSELSRRIPQGTVAKAQPYAEHLAVADELVYSQLPATILVKVGERTDTDTRSGRPKKVLKWILVREEGKPMFVNPRTMGLQHAADGQCFEARIVDGRIRHIKPIDVPECSWIKVVSGPLSVKTNKQGNQFAFVDDCYLGSRLIASLGDNPEGATVRCLATLNDTRWQCITARIVR